MIATLAARDNPDDRRRRDELEVQFYDIADRVALARSKRAYLLARARLGGADFNPATWPDDRVFRLGTVRTIPADFEPERRRRVDRSRRREQAIRIFGPGEAETRDLGAWLRRAGFDARRPHPNGAWLEVHIAATGRGPSGRILVAPSPNGLREARAMPGDNLAQSRRQARLRCDGSPDAVEAIVRAWQDERSGGA